MNVRIINVTDDICDSFMNLLPNGFDASRLTDNKTIVYGAITEDCKPAGVLVCDTDEGLLILNYLYTSKEFRRRKVATALLNAFTEKASTLWPLPVIEAAFPSFGDFDSLFEFFSQRDDFLMEEYDSVYHIGKSDRDNSAEYQKLKSHNNAVPLSKYSNEDFASALSLSPLSNDNFLSSISLNDIDKRISFVAKKDNVISSIILFDTRHSVPELVYVCSDNDQNGLINCFGSAAVAFDELFPLKDFTFIASNDIVEDFANKIFKIDSTASLIRASWIG